MRGHGGGGGFFQRRLDRPGESVGGVQLVRLVRLRGGQELWAESELLDETGVLGERLENVRFFQQPPDLSRARDPSKAVERRRERAEHLPSPDLAPVRARSAAVRAPREIRIAAGDGVEADAKQSRRALEGADPVLCSGKKFLSSRDAFARRRGGRLAEGEGVRQGERGDARRDVTSRRTPATPILQPIGQRPRVAARPRSIDPVYTSIHRAVAILFLFLIRRRLATAPVLRHRQRLRAREPALAAQTQRPDFVRVVLRVARPTHQTGRQRVADDSQDPRSPRLGAGGDHFSNKPRASPYPVDAGRPG